MDLDRSSGPTVIKIEPSENDILQDLKPNVLNDDSQVDDTLSADKLSEQFESLNVKQSTEMDCPEVDPSDGSFDDSDGCSSDDNSDGYSSDDDSDESEEYLPVSKTSGITIESQNADRLLIHRQYFIAYDERGQRHVYCWGVYARAPHVSMICRVEGATLHFCDDFDHYPNVGLYIHWKGMYFYFSPPDRALYRGTNGGSYEVVPLYPDERQARDAFTTLPGNSELDSSMNGNFMAEFSNPRTQPTGSVFLGWQGADLQQHEPFHLSSAPQSIPPPLSSPTCSRDNPGAPLTSRTPGLNSGVTASQYVDPRQLELPFPPGVSGSRLCPEPSANHHDALQNALTSGIPGVQQAVSTPGSSGSAPDSDHPSVTPPASSAGDGWPEDQVMRVEEPNPTAQDIENYTKRFSKKLKNRGIKVAYCWFCRHVKKKLPDKCAWSDLRWSTLARHLGPHYKLKPFPCDKCSYKGATKQHTEKHKERKH